eukprot:scaffold26754_cov113-Cylindrotheca_fusiformis.AAC.3
MNVSNNCPHSQKAKHHLVHPYCRNCRSHYTELNPCLVLAASAAFMDMPLSGCVASLHLQI